MKSALEMLIELRGLGSVMTEISDILRIKASDAYGQNDSMAGRYRDAAEEVNRCATSDAVRRLP